MAVNTSVEDAITTGLEAVAGVAPNVTLASAPILARTGLALVYHLLAEGACKRGTQHKHVHTIKHCYYSCYITTDMFPGINEVLDYYSHYTCLPVYHSWYQVNYLLQSSEPT